MAHYEVDTLKTKEMMSNIEKYIDDYNTNIDAFFKELLSYDYWVGEASKKYKEYTLYKMVNYSNYSEAFKNFIKTSRNIIEELETTISNNTLE